MIPMHSVIPLIPMCSLEICYRTCTFFSRVSHSFFIKKAIFIYVSPCSPSLPSSQPFQSAFSLAPSYSPIPSTQRARSPEMAQLNMTHPLLESPIFSSQIQDRVRCSSTGNGLQGASPYTGTQSDSTSLGSTCCSCQSTVGYPESK